MYETDQIRYWEPYSFKQQTTQFANIKPKWIKTFVYIISITVLWLFLSLSVKAGAVTILLTERNVNKPFIVYL